MDDVVKKGETSREIIKGKLRQYFDGKIVRKDLTKKIKEGAKDSVKATQPWQPYCHRYDYCEAQYEGKYLSGGFLQSGHPGNSDCG